MVAFDYLVVGAGSSGSVLAARLSEDPAVGVLLVEAGPDYGSHRPVPADLLDARSPASSHDWGFTATAAGHRQVPYQRGKVVGGTSAINAALALRGTPADFREWEARGLPGWNWDSVAPFFARLENDLDYRGAAHGADGPIPVCRWRPDEIVPEQAAFYRACRQAGFTEISDHNDPAAGDMRGVGVLPMNRLGQQRVSAARAYLDPVRQRPNLAIRPDSLVDTIRFVGSRAVGADVISAGWRETVHADRVILAAGAIGSPSILLRSGIGNASDLVALGIPVVADLPAVGASLWDHPAVPLFLAPQPGAGDLSAPCFQIAARYLDEDAERAEVFVFLATAADLGAMPDIAQALGGPVALELCAVLMRPRGCGRLVLHSTDPREQPSIELAFAAHESDRRRLRNAVRLSLALAADMRSVARAVTGLERARITSDRAVDAYVRDHVDSFGHALGTVPMGDSAAEDAAVDQRWRCSGSAACGSSMPRSSLRCRPCRRT